MFPALLKKKNLNELNYINKTMIKAHLCITGTTYKKLSHMAFLPYGS